MREQPWARTRGGYEITSPHAFALSPHGASTFVLSQMLRAMISARPPPLRTHRRSHRASQRAAARVGLVTRGACEWLSWAWWRREGRRRRRYRPCSSAVHFSDPPYADVGLGDPPLAGVSSTLRYYRCCLCCVVGLVGSEWLGHLVGVASLCVWVG